MPQKNVVSDFEKAMGKSSEPPVDILAGFAEHQAAQNAPEVPMTPQDINRTVLPPGSTPVGQRTMTPAEHEMIDPRQGKPGTSEFATREGRINPVTKRPFPGRLTTEDAAKQTGKTLREAAPFVAAAIPAALGNPEMSWPVRAAVAGVLGAGTEAGVQFFDPERPDSAAARGADILATGAMIGGTEAGGELLKMGGGALLKRYFPNIAEAIEQGATKFLHAVPSNDINVRANYELAQGDLQKIAKEMLASRSTLGISNPGAGVFSHDAPGGIVSAELRPTELYTHIKDYMSRMYNDERKWQIMRAGGQQLTVDPARAAQFDQDAFANAMRRVSRIFDPEEGAHKIAARVAANPTAPITPEEADILERATSALLHSFRQGDPRKQALDQATKTAVAVLEPADLWLNDALNKSLQDAGLPGINTYARRYAALSRVQDNLARMIPATERGRLGLGPAEVVSPSKIVRTITTMAGQNPGREIEDALRILSRAPEIPTPTGVPITPLPGRPGPNIGPAGPNVVPHPPAGGGGAAGALPASPAPPALPPAGGLPAPPSTPGAPSAGRMIAEKAKDVGYHLVNPPIPDYARGMESAAAQISGAPGGNVTALLAERGIRAPKLSPQMQAEMEDILAELPKKLGSREYRLIDKALKGDLTDAEAVATKLRKDLGLEAQSKVRYNKRTGDLPAPPNVDLSEF